MYVNILNTDWAAAWFSLEFGKKFAEYAKQQERNLVNIKNDTSSFHESERDRYRRYMTKFISENCGKKVIYCASRYGQGRYGDNGGVLVEFSKAEETFFRLKYE